MGYTPQTWNNNDLTTPLTAARLTTMENGISYASVLVNVKQYGAVGDGVTDDSSAIQSALNSLQNSGTTRGGTVYFPQGSYLCNSTLTIATPSTRLQGAGGAGQSVSAGRGTSRLVFPANTTKGINWNSTAVNDFRGDCCEDLDIEGPGATDAGNGIGLCMNNMSNVFFKNVTIHDWPTSLQSLGTDSSQDWTMVNVNLNSSHVGADIRNTNEIRWFGGMFRGAAGISGTPTAGDYGITVDTSSDTIYFFGTSLKGWDIGINFQDSVTANSAGHELHGVRFEAFNKAVYIGNNCNQVSIYGGNYNNSQRFGPGTGGTAFTVGSGAKVPYIFAQNFLNVTTIIQDNGATNPTYHIGGSHKPAWGNNLYYLGGTSAPTDSTFASAGLAPTDGLTALTKQRIFLRQNNGVWADPTEIASYGHFARNGTAQYRETMPWYASSSTAVAIGAAGVMSLTGIYLQQGDIVTNVNIPIGGTSASGPLNWWFALYGADGNLIAQTADQATAAATSNQYKSLALTGGPYTITSAQAGWGYVGVMFNTSTTQPAFRGSTTVGATISGGQGTQKTACGTSSSALTTTAPGTVGVVTATSNGFYALLT